MSATTAFPRSQHWRIDGFRVVVLLYKSHHRETCRTCGQRGAIHCVWADRDDGFSAAPEDFCNEHRPAKGTLPDLDYERGTHERLGTSTWTATTERLAANPAWPCAACGQPSIIRREIRCDRCTDPAHISIVNRRVITLDGSHIETFVGHDAHTLAETYHCADHR
jgi:hypothetical protein